MRYDQDAMMLVRAELCDRLESLHAPARRLSAAEFAERVDGIRSLAAAYGMTPVVHLSEALARAVREGGRDLRSCPTALYLGRLQDAIGCGTTDARASEAIIASISVRLSG
jgi:hypothetical protein